MLIEISNERLPLLYKGVKGRNDLFEFRNSVLVHIKEREVGPSAIGYGLLIRRSLEGRAYTTGKCAGGGGGGPLPL